ncbi:MAG: DUF59 domain-containing protein [Alphaproteobacteria bacterium]|nr:DUF59 domain-containing protein [Alphaproteobacteria bacterium]
MDANEQPAETPKPETTPAAADDAEWAEARQGVAEGQEHLAEGVKEVIRACYDPEIPVNIYDLGLIYSVGVDAKGKVWIDMTLTAPGCPVAGTLPGEVEERVKMTPGVMDAKVNLVWDPPWDQSRMSEAAKLELGLI